MTDQDIFYNDINQACDNIIELAKAIKESPNDFKSVNLRRISNIHMETSNLQEMFVTEWRDKDKII